MESKTSNKNRRRHKFLLTFFSSDPSYQVKEVNGYILVKQFNANTKVWEVAIYTKETWSKVEQWKNGIGQPS